MHPSYPELVVNVVGRPGAGKSTLIREAFVPLHFSVFRPSDILRQYAKQQQILLKSREDYKAVHSQLIEQDPHFMTDAVLAQEGVVVLDGLRVYRHARALREILGQNTYKTCTLECPEDEAVRRILNDPDRSHRDASALVTSEQVRSDMRSDLDPLYEMTRTMAMHDLTPQPINAGQPAAMVAEAVRPALISLLT